MSDTENDSGNTPAENEVQDPTVHDPTKPPATPYPYPHAPTPPPDIMPNRERT